jgi:hypothetical protein
MRHRQVTRSYNYNLSAIYSQIYSAILRFIPLTNHEYEGSDEAVTRERAVDSQRGIPFRATRRDDGTPRPVMDLECHKIPNESEQPSGGLSLAPLDYVEIRPRLRTIDLPGRSWRDATQTGRLPAISRHENGTSRAARLWIGFFHASRHASAICAGAPVNPDARLFKCARVQQKNWFRMEMHIVWGA